MHGAILTSNNETECDWNKMIQSFIALSIFLSGIIHMIATITNNISEMTGVIKDAPMADV